MKIDEKGRYDLDSLEPIFPADDEYKIVLKKENNK